MPIIISKNIWYVLLPLFFVVIFDAKATDDCVNASTFQQQKQDIIYTNLAGIGIVTAWGITNWDYFSNSPKSGSEGWFGHETNNGGADKLGHLYTSYVTSHGLSYLYTSWCMEQQEAALYGALSSFAILSYMEVGDSFSNFGFSKEDFLINGVGSLLGYSLYANPDLANKIDLRWQYGLHPNHNDIITDYENFKYFAVLKLNGFDLFRNSFLKHFELHLGYYTRGFDDPHATRERNVFFGIGLNLTDWFGRRSYKKTATVLRYIQIPGSNIEFDKRQISE